jgi:hypothetical protein
MPPIPVTATAALPSFENASIIVVRELKSVCRPINLPLLFNPGPSKNFLFIGKGQFEGVGEGIQGLFCEKPTSQPTQDIFKSRRLKPYITQGVEKLFVIP